MLVLYHKTEDKSKKKTHRSAFLSSLKGISKEKPSNKDNYKANQCAFCMVLQRRPPTFEKSKHLNDTQPF